MLLAVTADNVFSFVTGFFLAVVMCVLFFFVWLRLRWRQLIFKVARSLVFKTKAQIERRMARRA